MMSPSCPAPPSSAHTRPERIRRLGLLGGESAGKTTLAQALAERLNTAWVPEYGRERWLEIGGTFGLPELLHVAQEQVRREEAAAAALPPGATWLVCDTTPLTTLVYARLDHATAPPDAPEWVPLTALARRPYDLLVLCAPDFDFVQDGARRDAGFRAEQHALTLSTLAGLGHAHVAVRGPLRDRVAFVVARLADLAKAPAAIGTSTTTSAAELGQPVLSR